MDLPEGLPVPADLDHLRNIDTGREFQLALRVADSLGCVVRGTALLLYVLRD